MKKRKALYLLVLLATLISALVSAEEKRYYWSIDNSIGVTYGHARELVYQYTGSKDLMSELVWPLEWLVYYGTALHYNYGNRPYTGFYGNISVRFGFYMQSGTITDKDWLNTDSNGYFLTNFSAHEAISENSQWLDTTLGYGFSLTPTLIFRTGITASVMNLHWIARNGYTQYGPNTGNDATTYILWSSSFPKVPVYGTGIGYWQNWVSLAPIVELRWQALPGLSLQVGTAVYFLNSCNDQDDHYLRLLQFTEKMAGGIGFEPSIGAATNLGANLSLGLEASWRFITGLRGSTTIMAIGDGSTAGPYADTAGVDYSVARLALILTAQY
ncbi:omptin family outer membrane protease [Gracilinema caldarium]|uniref:omptin family outer membrane protease n=1 Tax=Gracilinema caldarium TaxID=215591 RepID=UPI0026EBCDAC|nr:omptin family outer membrane protease [Gracilinema caldarium]